MINLGRKVFFHCQTTLSEGPPGVRLRDIWVIETTSLLADKIININYLKKYERYQFRSHITVLKSFNNIIQGRQYKKNYRP